jgi:hypothetical protein
MSESCDMSDEDIETALTNLEALADGCPHCKELRDQIQAYLIILAARSAQP